MLGHEYGMVGYGLHPQVQIPILTKGMVSFILYARRPMSQIYVYSLFGNYSCMIIIIIELMLMIHIVLI